MKIDNKHIIYGQHHYHVISVTLLYLLKSFLSGRSQCVVLGYTRSKSISILQDVLHGSILEAQLYTLYCTHYV